MMETKPREDAARTGMTAGAIALARSIRHGLVAYTEPKPLFVSV